MTAATLPVLSFYSITHHPSLPCLTGTALRALTDEEVAASCELLLDTAQATDCACWLIDRRTYRREHPPQLHEWMQRDYFPRVRTALGRPLHVAFLATPSECARLRQLQDNQPQEWHFRAVHIGWFTAEACAHAWLQQAAEPRQLIA